MNTRTKLWAKTILKSIAGLVCFVLLAGSGYERFCRAQDQERFPQIGLSVDVGGRFLNIHCLGDGGPAVILNSGANQPGYQWRGIQAQIARFARVCWWDRAGTGWSELGPFPRTAEANARDLHMLLQASGTKPPFVMVGYSVGGHDIRLYNALYADEVAGMVLVDAAHEEEAERIGEWGRGRRPARWLWYPGYLAARVLAATGVLRMTRHQGQPRLIPDWTERQSAILAHLQRRPEAFAAAISSGGSLTNDALVRKAGGFGDKPLLVLTAGSAGQPSPESDDEVAAYREVWVHELQPKLARLSTQGKQVIVPNATHGTILELPEVVTTAVKEVVDDVVAAWRPRG
jgi:pimeloyl-ACP methyl ester carboxylesterase